MPAPHSTFTQVLSTSVYNYVNNGKFADNIYEGLRTFQVMTDLGGKVKEEGGESLVVQLEYATNGTAQWMSPYGTYNTNPQDVLTAAQFNWRQLNGTVIVTDDELVRNSGPYAMANLAKAKVRNLEKSLRTQLNTALFSTGSDPNVPLGLEVLVSTTGTVGGISRSANPWWQANVDSTTEALDVADMRSIYNLCTHNLDRPQAIVTTRALYEKYEQMAQSFQEISYPGNAGAADIGFEHMRFKGVPIWWDASCPSGIMYFLNFDYFKIHCHRDWEFIVKESMRPSNQGLEVTAVIWFGAFCPSNCRMLGKLSNKS